MIKKKSDGSSISFFVSTKFYWKSIKGMLPPKYKSKCGKKIKKRPNNKKTLAPVYTPKISYMINDHVNIFLICTFACLALTDYDALR